MKRKINRPFLGVQANDADNEVPGFSSQKTIQLYCLPYFPNLRAKRGKAKTSVKTTRFELV